MNHDGPVPGSEPLGGAPHQHPEDLAEGVIETGEWFGIGNEFTGVQIRKVRTRNGERLELHVPTRRYRTLLDAMQLEIIAAQDPAAFTTLFQRQLGSDEDGGLS